VNFVLSESLNTTHIGVRNSTDQQSLSTGEPFSEDCMTARFETTIVQLTNVLKIVTVQFANLLFKFTVPK